MASKKRSFADVRQLSSLYLSPFALIFLLVWGPLFKVYYFNSSEFSFSLFDLLLFCFLLSVTLLFLLVPLLIWRRGNAFITALLLVLSVGALINSYFLPAEHQVFEGELGTQSATVNLSVVYLVVLIVAISIFYLGRRSPDSLISSKSFRSALIVALFVFYVLFAVIASVGEFDKPSRFLRHMKEGDGPWRLSNNGNILVFSLDQVQASVVLGVLNDNPHLSEELDGFKFFSDAASTYPNTSYSISSTLRGRLVTSAKETILDAIRNESFLEAGAERGYRKRVTYSLDCHFCEFPILPEGERIFRLLLDFAALAQTAYYQGYGLSVGDSFPLTWLTEKAFGIPIGGELLPYVWKLDLSAFQHKISSLQVDSGPPVIEFRHFMATHLPAMYKRDCTVDGDVEKRQTLSGVADEVYCALATITQLVAQLKKNNIYDETLLFFISDHGSEKNINDQQGSSLAKGHLFPFSNLVGERNIKPVGAYNPMMFFKDFRSRGALQIFDTPVSLLDVAATVCESLGGCSLELEGTSLREEVEVDRERKYWRYFGGRSTRFDGGIDRLHKGLGEWWETRVLRGALRDNLVTSLYPYPEEQQQERSSYTHSELSELGLLGHGWATPERSFVWTLGEEALLFLPNLTSGVVARTTVQFKVAPFLPAQREHRTVRVFLGEVSLDEWVLDQPLPVEKRLEISHSMFQGDGILRFVVEDPESPHELGLSGDTRKLGFCLYEVKLIHQDVIKE